MTPHEAPTRFWEATCAGTGTDRRNQRRVRAWLLAWMGSWLAVLAAIKFDWLEEGPLATGLSIGTIFLGLASLAAYRRALRQMDELRRKIELEALAAALGVGVVAGLSWWLLQRAGAVPALDALWLITLMLVTHAAGLIFGARRYA